jgi:hypothetical protein
MATAQVRALARLADAAQRLTHEPYALSCVRACGLQLDNVREGASPPPRASAAGTDGGWLHAKPLRTRFATPTGIYSFDGESAWSQYDPHILVPKEWGKQTENWKGMLRDWPDPDQGMWQAGNKATWKEVNYKRCVLHRARPHTLLHSPWRSLGRVRARSLLSRRTLCPRVLANSWPLHRLPKYDRSGIEVNL